MYCGLCDRMTEKLFRSAEMPIKSFCLDIDIASFLGRLCPKTGVRGGGGGGCARHNEVNPTMRQGQNMMHVISV